MIEPNPISREALFRSPKDSNFPNEDEIYPYAPNNLIEHNDVLMQQLQQYEGRGGRFHRNRNPNDLTTAHVVTEENGKKKEYIQFPRGIVEYQALAHELGHALGKHQPKTPADYATPDEYAHARAVGEAEAMLNEYRIAKAMEQSIERIRADEHIRAKYPNHDDNLNPPPKPRLTSDKLIEFNGKTDTWYNHIDKLVGNNPVPEDFFTDPTYKQLVDSVIEYRKNLIPSSYGHLPDHAKLTYREEDILTYLQRNNNFFHNYQSAMNETATPLVGNYTDSYPDLIGRNPEFKAMFSKMVQEHLYDNKQSVAEIISAEKEKAGALVFGGQGVNTLIGSAGNDILLGGSDNTGKGKITIQAGDGNDILYSGHSGQGLNNRLEGGSGLDIYHTFNGEKIRDSDGLGKVYFDTTLIEGKLQQIDNSNIYRQGSETNPKFFAEKIGDDLRIYKHNALRDSHFITIENFQNGQLGIELQDNPKLQQMPAKGQQLYDLSLQKLQPWLDANKITYLPIDLEQLSAALAATLHENKMTKIEKIGLDDEKKNLFVMNFEPDPRVAKIDLFQAAETPVHLSVEKMYANEQKFTQEAQMKQFEREQNQAISHTRSIG